MGNFAKEEEVLAALAEEFGMELVDLTDVKVEPETLHASMPLKLVHRFAPSCRSAATTASLISGWPPATFACLATCMRL